MTRRDYYAISSVQWFTHRAVVTAQRCYVLCSYDGGGSDKDGGEDSLGAFEILCITQHRFWEGRVEVYFTSQAKYLLISV